MLWGARDRVRMRSLLLARRQAAQLGDVGQSPSWEVAPAPQVSRRAGLGEQGHSRDQHWDTQPGQGFRRNKVALKASPSSWRTGGFVGLRRCGTWPVAPITQRQPAFARSVFEEDVAVLPR